MTSAQTSSMKEECISFKRVLAATNPDTAVTVGSIAPRSGRLVALGGGDGEVTVHALSAGDEESATTLKGHSAALSSITFQQQLEDVIAASADDGSARMWDLRHGKVVRTFDNGGSCRSLDFNPRREFLSCISGDAIHVWDIRSKRQVAAVPAQGLSKLQWTPNGLLLVGAGVDGVGVYDLRNGQRVKHMSVRGEENRDGENVLILNTDHLVSSNVRLWRLDGAAEAPTASSQLFNRETFRVLFSPQGDNVVTLQSSALRLLRTAPEGVLDVRAALPLPYTLPKGTSALTDAKIYVSEGADATVRCCGVDKSRPASEMTVWAHSIKEVLRECGEDEAEEEESSQSMVTETAINTSCFEDESTLLAEDEESKDNVTISVKSVELRSRGMAEEEEEENQDSGGEEADSENIDPTSRRPRFLPTRPTASGAAVDFRAFLPSVPTLQHGTHDEAQQLFSCSDAIVALQKRQTLLKSVTSMVEKKDISKALSTALSASDTHVMAHLLSRLAAHAASSTFVFRDDDICVVAKMLEKLLAAQQESMLLAVSTTVEFIAVNQSRSPKWTHRINHVVDGLKAVCSSSLASSLTTPMSSSTTNSCRRAIRCYAESVSAAS